MFENLGRRRRHLAIDLQSVRDTLLYIESDLAAAPELDRLTGSIRAALAEIARLEADTGPSEKPAISAARFVRARSPDS